MKAENKPQTTIAVLPFVNMSSDLENEYFSDGITEEIINALAKIKQLKVTSRTSAFFFKNKETPLKRIAEELGVSSILEGSVRRSKNTLRITAQLIEAENDFHFWSETWDRDIEDIFEIQDEISLLIADKLREQFGHFEIQEHLVTKQTEKIEVYELSLKARFHFNKWNPEDMHIAISCYEKALALDPQHSESHLGLADCFGFMATTGFMPFEEAWGKAIALTQKALELNDNLPVVHYQLANIAFFTEGNFTKSMQHTKRALALKPNYVEAQQFGSFLNVISGQPAQAKKHLDTALSIDPLSPETQFFNGYFHYMTGEFDESLRLLNACLADNPKNIPAHVIKCNCLIQLGQYNEVIHYFDQFPPELAIQGDQLGLIGMAYAKQGDEDNLKRTMAQLSKMDIETADYRAKAYLFLIETIAGNTDNAFQIITQAMAEKSFMLLINFADPNTHILRSDSRYAQLQNMIFPVQNAGNPAPKSKALLDPKIAVAFSTKLTAFMETEEPFLDPALSLRSLAFQINLHPNQLSWLLNTHFNQNFSEYVNHNRIATFKKLAKNPKNENLTILGMAFESGFNSKTVFNTAFKKESGVTPKQFLKSQFS